MTSTVREIFQTGAGIEHLKALEEFNMLSKAFAEEDHSAERDILQQIADIRAQVNESIKNTEAFMEAFGKQIEPPPITLFSLLKK